MGYVSPHDRRTTQFEAVIKKKVIIDLRGEEPVIVQEDEQFTIVMPLHPVGTDEDVVVTKFAELLEAGPCSVSGEIYALEDLDAEGRGPEHAVPDRLKNMTQEEMIRYILQLEKGGAAPAAKAEASSEPAAEAAEATEKTEQKKTTTRRRKGADASTEAPEGGEAAAAPAAEPTAEEKLETVRLQAETTDTEVNVAF